MKTLFLALITSLISISVAFSYDDIHTSRENARRLPLPHEEGTFHFVVYGDRTGGPAAGIEVLKDAVVDTNLLAPDLVMTVGDLVQGYNDLDPWMEQMIEFRDVMNGLNMPWFPVAGNHDIYWRGEGRPEGEHEGNYEKHFGPLWFWFVHKNAAFVILYSDEGDPKTGEKGYGSPNLNKFSAEQLVWLEAELEKTKNYDHVFVFLHHPKWLNTYPGSNWDDVHRLLVAAQNVSGVFAGHIHRMRFDGVRDGIEYYCLATTGGALSMELPAAGFLHHLNVVTVRKNSFKVATLPVGSVIDPKSMTDEHFDDIDRLLKVLPKTTSSPIKIKSDGSTEGELIYTLKNPTRRTIEVAFGVETPDRSWVVIPDHHHLSIGPETSGSIPLHVRWKGGDWDLFDIPHLSLEISYLGDSRRYELPERSIELPFTLGPLNDDVFSPLDKAIVFDSKSALCIASREMAVPQGAMTLEAWIYPLDMTGRRGLITKTENSEFGIFVNDATPSFCIHLNGSYAEAEGEAGSLKVERWQHVAGVFDGAELRLYLDGKLLSTVKGEGQRTLNDFPLIIGADVDRSGAPTSHYEGRMDEVRLSRHARYIGEFTPQRRFEPDETTQLLLHLDRTIGPFYLDHSSGARHASSTAGSPLHVVEGIGAK